MFFCFILSDSKNVVIKLGENKIGSWPIKLQTQCKREEIGQLDTNRERKDSVFNDFQSSDNRNAL